MKLKPQTGLYLISILTNVVLLTIVRMKLDLFIAIYFAVLVYFVLTIFVFNQGFSFGKSLLIVMSGIIIVHVIPNIFDFESHTISHPEFMAELLGVGLGILYTRCQRYWKLLPTLMVLATLYVTAINQVPIENFILNSPFKKQKPFAAMTIDKLCLENKDMMCINDSVFRPETLTIVDFWFTACASCIRVFPAVEAATKDNKNKNIRIITACALMANQSGTEPYELLKNKNFTFPCYTITNIDSVKKHLGINKYPSTIVFKNKKVLFKGTFEAALSYAHGYKM